MGRVVTKTVAASFPSTLNVTGSKYYRMLTLRQFDEAETTAQGFESAEHIAHWLLRHGPVRLRFRWHHGMIPHHGTGRIEVIGEKHGRQTCALMGYDSGEAYPFRLLTPFGSGFGQLGRVWLSWAGLRKLLKEGARVDAPIV